MRCHTLPPRHGSRLEQQQYLDWAQQLAGAVEGPLRPLSCQIWLQNGPPDQAPLWLLRLVAELAAAWPRSLSSSSTSAAGSMTAGAQLTGWRAHWKVLAAPLPVIPCLFSGLVPCECKQLCMGASLIT